MLALTDGADARFSPDGTKVIACYFADKSTRILDVTGGLGQLVTASIVDPASWQRLAP